MLLSLPISRRLEESSLLTIFVGVLALGAISQITIPLWPVPITGQTLACLLAGLMFSPRWNFHLFSSYILLGLLGLPLFHGLGGGLSFLMAPSFGYILGFPLVAVLFSLFRHRMKSTASFYFWAFMADLPCLLLGVTYLYVVLGMSFFPLVSGFLIFLPGEFLKITIVYAISRSFSGDRTVLS